MQKRSVKSFWKQRNVDVRSILFDRGLPKNVYANKGRYYVHFTRGSKNVYVGSFKELSKAVQARDTALSTGCV